MLPGCLKKLCKFIFISTIVLCIGIFSLIVLFIGAIYIDALTEDFRDINKPLEQRIQESESIIYQPFKDGYALFQLDALYGLVDRTGKVVIQPKYRHMSYDDANLIRIETLNNKWGFIDKNDNIIIKPQFKFAEPFHDGLAAVQKHKKYGFIDKNGKYVIKPIFDRAYWFNNGLAAARIGDKWGIINQKGEFVIKPQFEYVDWISDDVIPVEINGKTGLINYKGEYIIKPQYPALGFGHAKISMVSLNGKPAYITKQGKILKTRQYDDIRHFQEGYGAVKLGEKWGLIDEKGKEVIKPVLEIEPIVSDGVFAFYGNNHKAGYMSVDGKVIIPPQYELAYNFSEGLAEVSKLDEKGNYIHYFINKRNEIVFKCLQKN